jgi:hypothetical protein
MHQHPMRITGLIGCATTRLQKFIFCRLVGSILLGLGLYTPASAHCIVGNRFFPSTLIVDDPCVADEMSMPTIAEFKNGDDPSAQELDISGEFDKTITKNFGVSIGDTWVHLNVPGGGNIQGFDNLETGFKYQFLTVPAAELAMSVSLDVDWGGTGNRAVGADPFTTLTPTFFVGQGFGFLPESMKFFKPLAVTAQVGYAVPTEFTTSSIDESSGLLTTTPNPQFLNWGGSLQYSMPYLKSAVQDLSLPDFFNHLIPLVEWNLETQVANFDGGERTTGTINPGVIYVANKYQLSVEAMIPVNRASGDDVGVIGQLHLYLDDMFPNSFGRPLLALLTEPRSQ